MKRYFSAVIFTIFLSSIILSGCANRSDRLDRKGFLKADVKKGVSEEGNIGRVVFIKDYGGKNLELWLNPPLKRMPLSDAEDYINIMFSYPDFPLNQRGKGAILEISFLSSEGKQEKIVLNREPKSPSEVAKLQSDAKECFIPVVFMEEFFLLKKDFCRIIKASSVHYRLQTPFHEFEGELPFSLIEDLEKNKHIYLRFTPWEVNNRGPKELQAELVKEAKKFFDALTPIFKNIKKGTKKSVIEEQYQRKFKNKSQDPETNCIEETIWINIGGQKDPLILGFNNKDELVYIRNCVFKDKITYLK